MLVIQTNLKIIFIQQASILAGIYRSAPGLRLLSVDGTDRQTDTRPLHIYSAPLEVDSVRICI